MHIYLAKSSRFESNDFASDDWWRRLQPTSSVSPVCYGLLNQILSNMFTLPTSMILMMISNLQYTDTATGYRGMFKILTWPDLM